MKLWLDDERTPPEGWKWAKSVREAKYEVLHCYSRQEDFEEASLDHDLGDGHDGLLFVDWLVECGLWPLQKPTVHSMNPPGRQRMQQTIDRYFKPMVSS